MTPATRSRSYTSFDSTSVDKYNRFIRPYIGSRIPFVRFDTTASVENIPDLLLFIDQACHSYTLPRPLCLELRLAVEEACVNIIKHGYAGLQPGKIMIDFQRHENQVIITITDFGREFDPNNYPPPDNSSDWDQRPVGGQGVFLLTKIMDNVRYTSNQGQGNQLELIKRIK